MKLTEREKTLIRGLILNLLKNRRGTNLKALSKMVGKDFVKENEELIAILEKLN